MHLRSARADSGAIDAVLSQRTHFANDLERTEVAQHLSHAIEVVWYSMCSSHRIFCCSGYAHERNDLSPRTNGRHYGPRGHAVSARLLHKEVLSVGNSFPYNMEIRTKSCIMGHPVGKERSAFLGNPLPFAHLQGC